MKAVLDSIRSCGWRQPGSLYLRSDSVFSPCGRLPIPLTVCPCCGEGVKQGRGFAWVTNELIAEEECLTGSDPDGRECGTCPFNPAEMPHKLGLLWVGAKFYPAPANFLSEAQTQGVSKRIAQIPKDLVLANAGEDKPPTVILLAHPKVTIKRPELGGDPASCEGPAIFSSFRADRIEYVVRGDETDEEIEALEKRGVTPVLVERSETGSLNFN